MNIGWLETVSVRVQERNRRESEPFQTIYRSNFDLWKKCIYLDSARITAKHNIAILEHETSDLISKGEMEQSVRNFSRKCHILHTELKPFNSSGQDNIKQGIDLSKVIYDQRKLLSNQEDEIKLARNQLSDAFNALTNMEEEFKKEVKERRALENRIAELELALHEKGKTIESLLFDNKQLTERIITEKNKNASQMDEMNQLLSRLQS